MRRTILVVPRSPLAPPADGPATPVRHRAVIAGTTGVIASTVGLVLLGIGSAAASTGPSPGPAAGPLPKLSVTTLASAAVSTAAGAVEVAVDVAVGAPPSPALPASGGSDGAVAQQGPVPTSTAAASSWAAADLPRTGRTSGSTLFLAALSLVTGAALLTARALRRSHPGDTTGSARPEPIPVRVDRRR